MKIEILGVGCPKCQELYDNAAEALTRSGRKGEIIKVTKLGDISGYGVMLTPALVIDGQVKAAGKISSIDEILKWITG